MDEEIREKVLIASNCELKHTSIKAVKIEIVKKTVIDDTLEIIINVIK